MNFEAFKVYRYFRLAWIFQIDFYQYFVDQIQVDLQAVFPQAV